MIKATTAPKPKDARLLVITYALATILAGATTLGLMKFEVVTPFLGSVFGLEGTGAQVLVLFIAFFHVFSLPFLIRLSLSPLARALSAVLVLLTSVFWMVFALQLQPLSPLAIAGAALVMVWAAGSYMILDGPVAIRALVAKPKK